MTTEQQPEETGAHVPEEEDAPAQDMAQLLEEAETREMRGFRRGEILEGTVVEVHPDAVMIDVGGKTEAVVPQGEMRSLGADPLTTVKPGERVPVMVLRPEGRDGQMVLSIDRARQERGWKRLHELLESSETFEAAVTGHNKGGLLVDAEGIQAFVPLSQVASGRNEHGRPNPSALDGLVGRQIMVKVMELSRRRGRVIVSERAAVEEWKAHRKEHLLEELREGEIRQGQVTAIRPFGIFIDIGGAEGLAHVTELSWERNRAPEELFHVGDEVEAYVLRVDRENGKVGLSVRRAHPLSWEDLVAPYSEGDIIPVRVTRLVTFGAFARVDGPLEGLIHISELADRRINHPSEVVSESQIVPVRIVRVDYERKRLGLSLRQARVEAELSGWGFDSLGRVTDVPEEIAERFRPPRRRSSGDVEHAEPNEQERDEVESQESQELGESGNGHVPEEGGATGRIEEDEGIEVALPGEAG